MTVVSLLLMKYSVILYIYVFLSKTSANYGVLFLPMVAGENEFLSPAVSGPISLRHFLLQEFLGGLSCCI